MHAQLHQTHNCIEVNVGQWLEKREAFRSLFEKLSSHMTKEK
jgi:hypothetical protein